MRRRSQQQAAAQQQHQHRSSTDSPSKRKPEPMRIKLLGGFRVWAGPRVIEEDQWRLRKARSLLKLLALV